MTDMKLRIINGEVLDGGGLPARPLSIVVDRGRICAIEPPDAPAKPDECLLDASGCVVCPGFIDIHSHGDLEPLAVPGAESKLLNGVTTEVCGNCGSTPFPIEDHIPGYLREKGKKLGVEVDWHSAGEYFAKAEAIGCAINRIFLVGHSRLRGMAQHGIESRPSSADELSKMRRTLEQAIKDGAWGLSAGLMYPPGCYAEQDEIEYLLETVAGCSAFFSCHLRSEGDHIFDALEEVVSAARATKARLHVSHLKLSGERNWQRIKALRTACDRAMSRGVDFSADWYPYLAWNANFDSLLPKWVYEGGTQRLLSRLRDPLLRERLAAHISELSRNNLPWDKVMVGSVSLPEHYSFQGRTIAVVAAELGLTPEDALFNLILAEGGRAEGIFFTMSEEAQYEIIRWPFVSVGSDGTARALSGPTAGGFPHPRSYGTAARMLRLVRERRLLPLPEAVRRMTSLPATQLGLRDRGLIQPGLAADIAIFDPAAVADASTYETPTLPPLGIKAVIVNGEIACRDGAWTGARSGRVLRRT